MPITRTAIVDDSGAGTDGTVIDNAWKQEFYNQIDALVGGAWALYAPAWTAPTNPVLGNGILSGTFVTFGTLTFFEIFLKIGSTTTLGSGAWAFSVPAGKPILVTDAYRGALTLSGRAFNAASATSQSVAGGVPLSPGGTAATFEVYATAGAVGGAVPFAFVANSQLQFAGWYRSG